MSRNAAYDEFLDGLLTQPRNEFSPFAAYDPDGDCIEFFLKSEPFHAQRIDGLLTVYRSQESSDTIVGAQIKRVSALCKDIQGKLPGFRVEIHDGKVPLVHILRVRLWLSREPDEAVHIYKFLTQKAGELGAEVEVGLFTDSP